MSDRLKVPRYRRKKIEDAIEKLIDMLDRVEPDPDLEPSLGSPGCYAPINQEFWAAGSNDDREEDDEREPPEDDEPSLGATHSIDQKLAWAGGRSWCGESDLEFDGETAPSADSEPSLGSCELSNQERWAKGGSDDREEDDEREWDPAEDGIGDKDGAKEQYGDAE
jgi:hypothetical protein